MATLGPVSLFDLHASWAWVVIVTNGLAGVWALVANKVPALRDGLAERAMWSLTIVAQLAIVVQVTLGAVLLQEDGREAPSMHVFYGFVALASVGIIYSYRQQLTEWRYLLYGYGGLFLMGLGIRAYFLTPGL